MVKNRQRRNFLQLATALVVAPAAAILPQKKESSSTLVAWERNILHVRTSDRNGCFDISGSFNDIRIYNRALTQEEIKRIYNEGRGVGIKYG